MLSGDLVAIASSAAKWAVEVRRADEVGPVLRRAFRAAVTPPQGPVFVSVPMDLLDEVMVGPVPARSTVAPATPRVELGPALGLLRSAKAPAVIAGDGVGRAGPGAVAALVRIAEKLGARTFHVPMNDRLDFPMDHPLYAGMLLPENARIRAVLDAHDVVLLAGARAFAPHHYTPGPAVGPAVTLIQLDDDPAEIGRNYPVASGLCGDVGLILDALAAGLGAPADGYPAAAAPARAGAAGPNVAGAPGDRLDPGLAAAVVAANLPDGAVVVEEAITVGLRLREQWRLHEPDSFHHTVGGGLGWGIGAAVGVSLGRPDRPVVAALGDGCALFGVHGLWMAANQHRPVTAVVFSNGEYRTLKNTLTHMRGGPGPFVGMDLTAPTVDWPALSGSLGVPAVRVDDAGHLGKLLRERSASDGPLLVEVPIS
jgi:benzoylformate decarboxylase